MVIIADYELEINLLGEGNCYSREKSVCPQCQGKLIYKDRRRRIMKFEGGRKVFISIRRLFCPACHRLHNEIPDVLCPFKHYQTEVIEGVVDDIITPDTVEGGDYPSESTMKRWKEWVRHNGPEIEGQIRSVGYRLLDLGKQFLRSTSNMLDEIRTYFRRACRSWLGFVNRLFCNVVGWNLEPWPPAWASAP